MFDFILDVFGYSNLITSVELHSWEDIATACKQYLDETIIPRYFVLRNNTQSIPLDYSKLDEEEPF